MDDVVWKDVVYYDETSPSCLRWACNIPYKGLYDGSPTVYKRVIGDAAGTVQKSNKRYKIKYKQKAYMVHRIVYELFNGKLDPSKVIDHLDGDSTNNRIDNLRQVDRKVNNRNLTKNITNKTGITGVVYSEVVSSYGKTYHYYVAQYSENGKLYNDHYSIDRLGQETAFKLACKSREESITRMNREGAGYTERHGL